MKNIFTLVTCLFFGTVFSQIAPKLDQSAIPNKTDKCGFSHIHEDLIKSDPEYRKRSVQFETEIENWKRNSSYKQRLAGTVYQVPVVVHVLHKGEAVGTGTNISDDNVRLGIKYLNDYWRKVSGTNGDGTGVDMNIEFVLAVRDPNGSCTNGIVRRDMSSVSAYVNNGVNLSNATGISDTSAKTGRWDTTKYYNIYLVDEIDNANCFTGGGYTAGYAYFASAHGLTYDGALMLSCSFLDSSNDTLAHEMGHAFNLYHTFEGDRDTNNDGTVDACPLNANGCGSGVGDCVSDIPAHIRTIDIPNLYFDCGNTTSNTCAAGTTRQAHMRNYMDYTGCANGFTDGQKTRAIAAMTTTRASFLSSNGNTSLTPPTVATVDFSSSASVACTGSTITFTDKSSCNPNSTVNTPFSGITYSWNVVGPVTLTSNLQNPTFTFSTPGTYNVTLSVTNANGTASKTSDAFVRVSGLPNTGTNTCTPTSTNNGNFNLTVNSVSFNTLNKTTSTLTNTAYSNFICSNNTTVTEGQTYTLTILARASSSLHEYCKVWIDFNNNGIIDASPVNEIVLTANTTVLNTNNSLTASVTIPSSAVKNTLLRMRVMGEASSTPSSSDMNCSVAYYVGDVEDYGIYVISSSPACSAPTITASTGASRCGTGTLSLSATPSAGVINWYAAASGGASLGTGTSFTTPSIATTTTYFAEAVNGSCVSASRTAVVATVTANPTITTSAGASRCGTGTLSLSATPSAGVINWYAAASGGASLGTGTSFTTPSIATTTTYHAEAVNGSCISASRTAVVATIIAIPTITASTGASRCGTGTLSLSATPSAGVVNWYAASTGGSSLGTGTSFTTPSISSTTTYYAETVNGSCISASRTAVVATVTAIPTITASTGASRCGTGTLLLSATPSAGVVNWYAASTGGSSLGTGTSFTTPSISSTTTYYSEAVNGSCISASRTAVVATVNSVISPSFDQVASICSGATLSALPLTSNNAIGGSWSPALDNTTTTTYTFTPNEGQCANTTTMTVTVNPNTNPTFDQVASICSGATLSALPLTSNNAISGTWSPALNNTATTTYTFTPNEGQCVNTTTMTITVNSNITPSFTQMGTVCKNTAGVTLPTTSNNSVVGTWSPIFNSLTTTTYTFTPSAGQCASTSSMTVTIMSVAKPTVSSQTFCNSAKVSDLVAIGTSLKFYNVSTGGTPLASNTNVPPSNYYYVSQTLNGCEGDRRLFSVSITPGTVPTFTQVSPICQGATLSPLPTTSNNSITGVWSPALNNLATTTYTFTPNPGSCTTTTTMTINVNTIGVPTFTQMAAVCKNTQGVTLPTTSNNGISGTWSPAFNNLTATTYTFTPTVGQCTSQTTTMTVAITSIAKPTVSNQTFCGSAKVSDLVAVGTSLKFYNVSSGGTPMASTANVPPSNYYYVCQTLNGCEGDRRLFSVTITPGTVPTFTQVAPICPGATLSPLPTTSNNGITGAWSPALNNMATTTYTFTPNSGQCGTIATMTISVNIVPAFTQMSTVCKNTQGVTLPTTSNNGISGTWSPVFNNLTTTTYTFTPTPGQCALTTTMIVNITSIAKPTVSNQTFCGSAKVSDLVAIGTNLKFYNVSSGGTPMASTANVPPSNYYYVSQTLNGCEGDRRLFSVTITPGTVPTFTQVAPICPGATLSPLPTTSNNGITGVWSPALNNMATTTYTFTPNSGHCGTTTTMTISVNIVPAFTQMAAVCKNTQGVTLPTTSNNGISGTWSPAFNNLTTTTYTFTPTPGQCALTTTMIVNITSIAKPTVSNQTFCGSAKVSDLVAIGTNLKFYNVSSGGTPMASTANVPPSNYYYVSQTVNGCEGDRRLFSVTITPKVTPTFTQVAAISSGSALSPLPTTSTNGITGSWTPMINNTVTTTYTFTPNVGVCANTATMTIVVNPAAKEQLSLNEITSNVAFEVKAIPNPYSRSFQLEATTLSSEIITIDVYDMIGKRIESRVINSTDLTSNQFGVNYADGIYNIVISQGKYIQTIRVIKKN